MRGTGSAKRHGGEAAAAVAALVCGLAAAGCEVAWGGGQIALEDPAPPPDTTAAEALEPEQIPLPDGPFLHLVRLRADGSARSAVLARFAPGGEERLSAIEIVEGDDPTFRARFDSAFYAPGTELDLFARGGRIGTLALEGSVGAGAAGCPSAAAGTALLVPGQDAPEWAFALRPDAVEADAPRRIAALPVVRSMSVASPVLAERLIGGDRAFLAQRVALGAVRLRGDTLPGMVATYLIADSLAGGPPGDDAVSLFFMARFEPTEGYIPIWEEVRRYDGPEAKEAYEHLEWMPVLEGRLDAVRRYGGDGVRVALSLSAGGEEPEISWVEPEGCATPGLLEGG